ncbi:2-amino-4-hydroxy-6-hydroxymethyldihydropteridine diphosphokinase [Roseivirga sp. UBA1976]|uniref:2-amino-4-hydroxy-6- hydroxymethyldihydropteridine diphosphokinase n=1 Tax=Roseivirga sp. UBA1976 TaxID=1947386 RepID=UPI002580180D|nr:2-amino-4-hydroxy-6-hydroxymethyldihydropteridine diphosphokinase [Roseivirga sp. UBA1976]MEC7754994.1 2-amino-4-hydroxy-6-hydroxymethyldihydropteridine diphosphokinase [Bacteroidota bacterium]|tara:strand:- start:5573 stop:6067 length:495 start_codon:yes stop_codon:yes gene_type:complete
MSGIYLLLGSNIGRRAKNLERAREMIVSHGITIKKESEIYETAAWGKEDQEAFLNQVIEVETGKSPQRVLFIVNMIEKEMGRERFEKWGSRLIDIDILYFGDIVFEEDNLLIPHPEIQNRRFTLAPLVEIAPQFLHPKLEKTQAQLLAECPDALAVEVYEHQEV